MNKRYILLSFPLALVLGVCGLVRLAPQVPAPPSESDPAGAIMLADETPCEELDANEQAQGQYCGYHQHYLAPWKPLKLDDIPQSRFRSQLESLPLDVCQGAIDRVRELEIPVEDLPSLHVDIGGMLFYVCAAPKIPPEPSGPELTGRQSESSDTPSLASASIEQGLATETAAATSNAAVSVSNPPARSSRPGAPNILFLDFNGMTVSKSSAWGKNYSWTSDHVCKAFDTDGNTSTFSDSEQAAIIDIWERVAEDYLPFNVNVTTVAPTSAQLSGNRVAIALITSKTDADWRSNPEQSAGGVAYLDVFSRSSYYPDYVPAFIYYDNLASNAKYIAEAVSHEIGHNMGLSHDGIRGGEEYHPGHGNGVTSWGPIMGASYYSSITQWSKGEYYNSSNKEDDLAILSGKMGYASDEDSGTLASARSLGGTTYSLSGSGVVGRSDDVDLFQFTSTGSGISFTLLPARLSAGGSMGNLDVKMELLNSSGTVIGSFDTDGSPSLSGESSAIKGQKYYLRVSGAGEGSPMDYVASGYTSYGSLGAYSIVIDIDGRPSITSHPMPATVYSGSSHTFNAYSPDATSWQWYHDSMPVGSSSPLLRIDPVGESAQGFYWAKATNSQGFVYTKPAYLRIMPSGGEYKIYACGTNTYGQLGDGTTTSRKKPVSIIGSIVSVYASDNHVLAIDSAGNARSWGQNSYGILGNNGVSYGVYNSPQLVSGAENMAKVVSCLDRSFFIKTDGALFASGRDSYGSLLDEFYHTPHYVPKKVKDSIVAMSPGVYHTLFMSVDGILYGCGNDRYGELGTGGGYRYVYVPTVVAVNVVGFSAGNGITHYIDASGNLFALGSNYYGTLGDGTYVNRASPVHIASDVAQVVSRNFSAYYITKGGDLFSMGLNSSGQLGDGSYNDRASPYHVASGVSSVYTSGKTCFFIKDNGDLFAMGDNAYNQIANNDERCYTSPVLIDRHVVNVAPASGYTLFLKSDTKANMPGEAAKLWLDIVLGYSVPESLRTLYADADHDGLSNIIEYAMGSNPASSEAGVVLMQGKERNSIGEFVFSVTLSPEAKGLRYTLHYSEDLKTWSSASINYYASTGDFRSSTAGVRVMSSPHIIDGRWRVNIAVAAKSETLFARLDIDIDQ